MYFPNSLYDNERRNSQLQNEGVYSHEDTVKTQDVIVLFKSLVQEAVKAKVCGGQTGTLGVHLARARLQSPGNGWPSQELPLRTLAYCYHAHRTVSPGL